MQNLGDVNVVEVVDNRYSDLKSRRRREMFRQRREVLFTGDFMNGTLTKYKYKMLHWADQLEYLNIQIQKQVSWVNRGRQIGGYYHCKSCAEKCLFEGGADISEEDE